MRIFFTIIIAASLIGLSFITKNKPADKSKKINPLTGYYSPVAVLELFTSEGCSSCPPADNLLPQLVKSDSNIIALSFHVDYWNRLGWTDPFSNSAYSERQNDYVHQFKLESAYTPELVVNGEYELVGSDQDKASSTIKTALQEKAFVKLSVENVTMENNRLKFLVHPEGEYKKTNIVAALVQKNATMNVLAGENSGAKLSHTNVVRAFKQQTAADKNEFELDMPGNLGSNDWQLIIYTQQKNDLKITGAVLYKPN